MAQMDEKDLMKTVREFRLALGMTQVQFGLAIGKTVATVIRYETLRPPKAAVLVKLHDLAHAKGLANYAGVFGNEVSEQLGIPMGVKYGHREFQGILAIDEEEGELAELIEVVKLVWSSSHFSPFQPLRKELSNIRKKGVPYLRALQQTPPDQASHIAELVRSGESVPSAARKAGVTTEMAELLLELHKFTSGESRKKRPYELK